jgi:hypothetical protein
MDGVLWISQVCEYFWDNENLYPPQGSSGHRIGMGQVVVHLKEDIPVRIVLNHGTVVW